MSLWHAVATVNPSGVDRFVYGRLGQHRVEFPKGLK